MTTYIYQNISELIDLRQAYNKNGRNLIEEDIGLQKNQCIVFNDTEILWVGKNDEIPKEYIKSPHKMYDLSGHVVTPEIVDSHTHLVFAGDRSDEYVDRLNGVDYQTIAKRGGGILYTGEQTRNATFDELLSLSEKRVESFIKKGIGTVEIKSGYGLDPISEEKILQVIKSLKEKFYPRAQIFSTYLGAHAVPTKYKSSGEYVANEVLPSIEKFAKLGLIDFVDVFHEVGYFTQKDVETIFSAASKLNVKLKIHADEFNDNGGLALAVALGCASADHLLCSNSTSFSMAANSETVATLLPGTGLFLGKCQAKAKQMLDAGVCISIASDFNPGSCHFPNLLQIAVMMAPTYKMNLCQLWAAITLNAAKALGLKSQGVIAKGFFPRFSVFKANKLSLISYSWGENFSVTPPHY